MHGDDEDHQRKGAACSVDRSIVVQHLVDDGNHAGGHGHHNEIQGTVGPQGHLHRNETDQDDGKTQFPAYDIARPANPRPNARQEHGHRGIGGDTPPETGVTAVSAKKSVVAEGQQQTGHGLRIDAVGIGRPIGVGVGAGLTKPIQFHRSRGVPHQESCTPKCSNGGKEEGNAEEIILDVMKPIPVFLALKFNQHDGDGEGQEAPDEENEEILVGGLFIEGNGEYAIPNGQETDAHHHDLREFHQEHVVLAEIGVGAHHCDGARFRRAIGHDAAREGRSAWCRGGFHSDGCGFSPWRCHGNQWLERKMRI